MHAYLSITKSERKDKRKRVRCDDYLQVGLARRTGAGRRRRHERQHEQQHQHCHRHQHQHRRRRRERRQDEREHQQQHGDEGEQEARLHGEVLGAEAPRRAWVIMVLAPAGGEVSRRRPPPA